MVDALDAPHVAGGDRMQRRQRFRMARGLEATADRGEDRIGAAEPEEEETVTIASSGIRAAASSAVRTRGKDMVVSWGSGLVVIE
jgi:hypothetical protein